MHIFLYNERPDINAVVHAHPPTATGFAVAGIPLTECVLPEVVITLGAIPIADYGTPGGAGISEPIRKWVRDYDAYLLENQEYIPLLREEIKQVIEEDGKWEKSTLFKMLAGEITPTAGDVFLHGHCYGRPAAAWAFDEIAKRAVENPTVWVTTRRDIYAHCAEVMGLDRAAGPVRQDAAVG